MSNFNDHIKKIFKAKEWFFPSPVKDEVVPKRPTQEAVEAAKRLMELK